MARRPPPTSLTDMRDMLLPAVFQSVRMHLDLSSDIYIDFRCDCLNIIVLNDRTSDRYEGLLMTRCEMQISDFTLARLRLDEAITSVLPKIIDTSEYDEVLACQAAMDDLAT